MAIPSPIILPECEALAEVESRFIELVTPTLQSGTKTARWISAEVSERK